MDLVGEDPAGIYDAQTQYYRSEFRKLDNVRFVRGNAHQRVGEYAQRGVTSVEVVRPGDVGRGPLSVVLLKETGAFWLADLVLRSEGRHLGLRVQSDGRVTASDHVAELIHSELQQMIVQWAA